MNENEQNVQTDALQSATADEYQETADDSKIGSDSEFTPNEPLITDKAIARDTEASAQSTVSEKAEAPFVSVQYNHKNRDFTKDEAITLIQKGMHTESLRTKLEYLADYYNLDVNTLVDQLVNMPEAEYRTRLEKFYGKDSDEVNIGIQIYREKQSDGYKKIVADRENSEIVKNQEKEIKSVNSRLADEYLMLKSEIPDAPDYAHLPDSVIIEAANGTRDLLSAYLCHLNREKIKIEAAKKSQEAAALASSKSMKSTLGDNINSQERSFLSGLWSK